MSEQRARQTKRRLAEAVRDACVQAALAGYEQAAFDGLCHEGAWENAISAIQRLDLEAVIQRSDEGG
jgi:hypothetical protein